MYCTCIKIQVKHRLPMRMPCLKVHVLFEAHLRLSTLHLTMAICLYVRFVFNGY